MATAVQWTQCILIKCDEDDFGVSVIFHTSQEIQCLLYAEIFLWNNIFFIEKGIIICLIYVKWNWHSALYYMLLHCGTMN